jgi:streptogramin lyase
MIFQNFGYNQNYPVAAGAPASPTYPDQSLATWTSTETAAWLAAGSTQTTTNFGYASTSTRIGTSLGGGSNKYDGGALASNGKIYCPPESTTAFLVINSNNDTVATTGSSVNNGNSGARYDKITNRVYGFGNYDASGNNGTYLDVATEAITNLASGIPNLTSGPVQALDGNKLYMAKLYSGTPSIYEWNISAGTATNIGAQGGDKYPKGTLAANGKIYWGPGGSGTFCELDPATSTITNFGSVAGDSYGPLVAHYDGYLYCFPRFNSVTSILRVTPSTRAVSTITTSLPGANYISMGGCVGLDGRIYVARENGGIYWYDPYANSVGTITMDSGDTSFGGVMVGANGDLYCIPWSSAYVHKIALTTGAGTAATQIVSQYNFGGRMCWQ